MCQPHEQQHQRGVFLVSIYFVCRDLVSSTYGPRGNRRFFFFFRNDSNGNLSTLVVLLRNMPEAIQTERTEQTAAQAGSDAILYMWSMEARDW